MKCTVKESLGGKMVLNIMVNIKMEKNTEKELSISQMETVTKGIGKKAIKTVRERYSARKDHKYNQENGKTGSL